MSISFRDDAGRVWTVIEIRRHAEIAGRVRDFLPEPYTKGWLLFQSEDERRRFAPIPNEWERLPEVRLRALLGLAMPAPSSGGAGTIARRLNELFPSDDADGE